MRQEDFRIKIGIIAFGMFVAAICAFFLIFFGVSFLTDGFLDSSGKLIHRAIQTLLFRIV
jgi:hypothetical protein